jgi:hypothetical protein
LRIDGLVHGDAPLNSRYSLLLIFFAEYSMEEQMDSAAFVMGVAKRMG